MVTSVIHCIGGGISHHRLVSVTKDSRRRFDRPRICMLLPLLPDGGGVLSKSDTSTSMYCIILLA